MRSVIGLTALFAAAAANAQTVDRSTLINKVLLGYQGWFRCPLPGTTGQNWSHWAGGVPTAATLSIDQYPDLREFEPDELCVIPNMNIRAGPAYLFSSASHKTVMRHFRWMQQYGLDGVLAQRFVTDIPGNRAAGDLVLRNIMAAAERYGRTFAIEYDVTGSNPATVAAELRQDWNYLVNTLKITASEAYLFHAAKPVVSVWGLGFKGGRNPPEDPAAAGQIVEWFRSSAEVTYIGGTPSGWRTLTSDAFSDPDWTRVYAAMDVIQPWAVGRYGVSGVDSWATTRIAPDLALAEQRNQLYMPVIFPGFSWHNLNRTADENQIPRNRGEFLWRQAYNAKRAGARLLKIAMFDEVNEGTAIFKAASHREDAPDQGYWLTLDADGFTLPSDWYLRLAGEISRIFHGQAPLTSAIPANPGPPWAGDAGLTIMSAASFEPDILAPEQLASAMGSRLASVEEQARALPLPLTLGGAQVTAIDSTGRAREAPLTYVSPGQVNFQTPAETALGPASLIITNTEGNVASGLVTVAAAAPGIFSAAGNGSGAAAAVLRIIHPDGGQTSTLTFDCSAGTCTPTALDLGKPDDLAILEFFGTGIRGFISPDAVRCTVDGVAVPVRYAGPQPEFPGMDQVNVELPRTLMGKGEVAVILTVGNRSSNAVTVRIQ